MKTLQVISDIHLEFLKDIPIIEKYGDDLLLAGDIGNPFSNMYVNFISNASSMFDRVFILLGNHEYYNCKHTEDVIKRVQNICDNYWNVHFLNCTAFKLSPKTVLIGATLWSDINPDMCKSYLNDFRLIPACNPDTYKRWHASDLLSLSKMIEEVKLEDKKAIVATHHGPSRQMNGIYKGNSMQSAFTTDLEYMFKPPVIAWASGHVHSNVDILINGIRSVSNAKGYGNEKTGFKWNVVIDYV